jgi:hypothetical protein
LAANVVAPYLLTALINRPRRLAYVSSSMHRGGRASLAGLDWGGRRRPDMDGRVQQRRGPWLGAHDDGRRRCARRSAARHLTQVWLATSDDPEARTSGGYWYHQRREQPARSVDDQQFQDQLLEDLARFTATRLV